MEEEKVAMFCTTCNKKVTVLEGEVTCPDCGALLEAVGPEEDELEDEDGLEKPGEREPSGLNLDD